jgi:hypothetical protein
MSEMSNKDSVTRRHRPGLVVAVCLAVAALCLVLILGRHDRDSSVLRYSAHEATLRARVKKAIEADVPTGITGSDVRCEAASSSTITCQENFASGGNGTGVATYNVTIDRSTGHYTVSPVISIRGTSG